MDSRTIVYEVIDITVNVCGGVAVALVPLVGGLSALESIGPARYVASGVMGVTTIVWLVIYQQGKGLLQGLKRGEPPTDFFGRVRGVACVRWQRGTSQLNVAVAQSWSRTYTGRTVWLIRTHK